jgi:AP-3 complex subunit delta-1
VELNPVSSAAQKKVPLPDDLDLDTPINPDLPAILQASQAVDEDEPGDDVFHTFYYEREPSQTATLSLQPQTTARLQPDTPTETEPLSYQSAPDSPATLARRKAERLARARDDPFYIAPSDDADPRIHDIISKTNGDEEFDVDSIPIIDLQIDPTQTAAAHPATEPSSQRNTTRKKKPVRKFVIAPDETLDPGGAQTPTPPMSQSLSPSNAASHSSTPTPTAANAVRPTRTLLTVDSSTLQNLTLEGSGGGSAETDLDILRREAEEAEMARALREVERKRLEMQREAERERTTLGEGVDVEGTMVVRRKKKKRTKVAEEQEEGLDAEKQQHQQQTEEGGGVVEKKKKKKKVRPAQTDEADEAGGEVQGKDKEKDTAALQE